MPATAPFLKTISGVHRQIDFEALQFAYPEMSPDVWNVASASDLISWEQLRHWYGIEGSDAIPCDVFVWGKGASPDLRMTRVGDRFPARIAGGVGAAGGGPAETAVTSVLCTHRLQEDLVMICVDSQSGTTGRHGS